MDLSPIRQLRTGLLLALLLAACATGPVGAGDHPATILIIGDSLAQGYSVGLRRVVDTTEDHRRNARIEDLVHVGSGLIRRGRLDLPALLDERLSSDDPPVTAIAVSAGINDVGMPLGAVAFYGDAWRERYREKIHDFLAVAATYGVPVFWIGLPAVNDTNFRPVVESHIRPIHEEAVPAGPGGVVYVDTVPLTTVDGAYSATVPGIDGTPVRARTGDGIHFTAAGYTLVGHHVIEAMETYLGRRLRPGSGWDQRADASLLFQSLLDPWQSVWERAGGLLPPATGVVLP